MNTRGSDLCNAWQSERFAYVQVEDHTRNGFRNRSVIGYFQTLLGPQQPSAQDINSVFDDITGALVYVHGNDFLTGAPPCFGTL